MNKIFLSLAIGLVALSNRVYGMNSCPCSLDHTAGFSTLKTESPSSTAMAHPTAPCHETTCTSQSSSSGSPKSSDTMADSSHNTERGAAPLPKEILEKIIIRHVLYQIVDCPVGRVLPTLYELEKTNRLYGDVIRRKFLPMLILMERIVENIKNNTQACDEPFFKTLLKGKHVRVIERMLEYCQDPNDAEDLLRLTIYHANEIPVIVDVFDIVQLLLNHGADPRKSYITQNKDCLFPPSTLLSNIPSIDAAMREFSIAEMFTAALVGMEMLQPRPDDNNFRNNPIREIFDETIDDCQFPDIPEVDPRQCQVKELLENKVQELNTLDATNRAMRAPPAQLAQLGEKDAPKPETYVGHDESK